MSQFTFTEAPPRVRGKKQPRGVRQHSRWGVAGAGGGESCSSGSGGKDKAGASPQGKKTHLTSAWKRLILGMPSQGVLSCKMPPSRVCYTFFLQGDLRNKYRHRRAETGAHTEPLFACTSVLDIHREVPRWTCEGLLT